MLEIVEKHFLTGEKLCAFLLQTCQDKTRVCLNMSDHVWTMYSCWKLFQSLNCILQNTFTTQNSKIIVTDIRTYQLHRDSSNTLVDYRWYLPHKL